MGKSLKRLQKKRKLNEINKIFSANQNSEQCNSFQELGITDEDLKSTLKVLAHLNKRSNFNNQEFFSVKKEIFNIVQNSQLEKNNKINLKITNLLEEKHFNKAIFQLKLNYLNNIKLGTVQRWIRLASLNNSITARTNEESTEYYRLLDMIIRVSDPSQIFALEDSEDFHMEYPSLRRFQPFLIPVNSVIDNKATDTNNMNDLKCSSNLNFNFKLLISEKNLKMETHIKIFTLDNSISHDIFDQNYHYDRMIKKLTLPFVQKSFILTNVFTKRECENLLIASDSIGYVDDFGYSFSPDASEGAAGCVWLMEDNLMNPIFERVKQLLPQELNDKALTGLNARFRFYRYSKNALYRPHVDGSWPGSGLVNGEYKFDKFGNQWSCLTFLIYLNQDFDGGETSFFWPSTGEGILNVKGVKPSQGCVLVFPHGDTSGALIHEGSQVTDGFKYVIRTDVLYEKI
ncbi:hypothetical protein HDU92_005209 [Lobulomyces angularis]|nr:hypothetical protein HDU92_005209 [Lobulomyces angularis]